MKTLSIISLLALLTLKASAEFTRVPLPANFAITATMQDYNSTTNATTITVPVFVKNTITTKVLLPIIARDEHNAGKYSTNAFPAGARLVFFLAPTSVTNSYYAVVDNTGTVLVDVSNLITFEPENDVVVNTYVKTISTGLYKTLNTEYIANVSFDDTGVGGTLTFDISYTVDTTTTETESSKGIITESANSKLGAASGTGYLTGALAVLTAPAQTISGKVSY